MLSDDVSYFAYLEIEKKIYYISGMDTAEVIKKVMLCKYGDMMEIKGLGKLRIYYVYFRPHIDGDHTVKEIGLMCSRLDA